MNSRKNVIWKYELPLFLVLTYALSWWSAPLMNGQIIPYGPAIAAAMVLGISAGRQGLVDLWHGVTRWRIPFLWYVAGPAIIVSYHIVGFVLNLVLGAVPAALPYLSSGTFWELLLIGGLWEEPGWSGYLLPRMKRRFGDHPHGWLLAALATGVFRSLWHFPLLLYGKIPWFDIFLFSFAFQIIIAWVFYRSGGSVLAVMVMHFASNLMGSFTYPLFTGTAHTTYMALFMAAACFVAVILVSRSGLSLRQVSDYARE